MHRRRAGDLTSPKASQLRDSAGFAPDFAALRTCDTDRSGKDEKSWIVTRYRQSRKEAHDVR